MNKESSDDESDLGSHGNDTLSVVENLESSTSEVPNNLGMQALNHTGKNNNDSNSATTEATESTTAAATAYTTLSNTADFTTDDSAATLSEYSAATIPVIRRKKHATSANAAATRRKNLLE